jgi:putative hydrolase of the HAD superfamily
MASSITALFFDIGGVLLSNGWEAESRRKAVHHFDLDPQDFEKRHEQIVDDFEKGRIRLDEYLDRTLFFCPRSFSKAEFTAFIQEESLPKPDSLELLAHLPRQRYLLATVNNESYDLNLYRIEKFGLKAYFSVFLSSCFLGLKKPDTAMYRAVLDITQRSPEETVVIDDRQNNVDGAAHCGMNTILFQDAAQCARDLQALGIRLS